jgi:hypothetical protein
MLPLKQETDMEIAFLIDGFYLVDAVTDDVIEGPFDTEKEARAAMDVIMAPANWE